MVADSLQDAAKKEEEEEEIELSLELSLGPNKLMGSSSIASCLPLVQDSSELLLSLPGPHSSLSRTSSLPLESEKERRRRKQQQSLRRLEAKRRRSEKQRILKEEKKASESYVHTINPPEGREEASISDVQKVRPDQLRTQGGFDFSTKNSMEDMPSVFTTGDDPNGRRVDGILYKYGRGEEVRIMCICHGNFYSPAEFIRHAGGTNVDCPLKRIVMDRSSSFL